MEGVFECGACRHAAEMPCGGLQDSGKGRPGHFADPVLGRNWSAAGAWRSFDEPNPTIICLKVLKTDDRRYRRPDAVHPARAKPQAPEGAGGGDERNGASVTGC